MSEKKDSTPNMGLRMQADGAYVKTEGFTEGRSAVARVLLDDCQLEADDRLGVPAGIWGFIDTAGTEVIAPQYLYSSWFENRVAIVAKGQWVKNPQTGLYGAAEEKWGGIDPQGNTQIPFVFDDIRRFSQEKDRYVAHFGGWEAGGWGVIDRQGNWLMPPHFHSIFGDCTCRWIAFCNGDMENPLLGLYDIKKRQTAFAPQFEDVEFGEQGEVFALCPHDETYRKIADANIE